MVQGGEVARWGCGEGYFNRAWSLEGRGAPRGCCALSSSGVCTMHTKLRDHLWAHVLNVIDEGIADQYAILHDQLPQSN